MMTNAIIHPPERKVKEARQAEMLSAIEYVESVANLARHNLEYQKKVFIASTDEVRPLPHLAFAMVLGQASLSSDDGAF